ncbi:GAF domain-containing protein [uncultured Methylobacterium sp.]|uniref:sensor histidine kinase n=1 Tax=uncultured Methylobacterium sp. TaxID=157278 RepID=UPI00260387EE|nr:GAF domain-containing protein [uncultured Methylobacterium sp.]
MSLNSDKTDFGPAQRAKALADLMVLDTPEEQAFNDLVFVAAKACDVPIALITLLDTDRQWFKAKYGLEVCETEIEHSVCRIEIDQGDLLEIVDLTNDARTKRNPLVTGVRHFRAYAGAPLMLRSGAIVGRLCVIDTAPRPQGLSEAEKAMLQALARLASENLELRRVANASERLTGLQTALVEIGETIRSSHDTAEMASATAAIVGRALATDRAGFGSVDDDVETIDVETDWTAPGIMSIAGRHRLEEYGSLRKPLVGGDPLIVWDALTDDRTLHNLESAVRVGVRSLVDMPVRDRGKTIAVFFVHSAHPRPWPAEEISFLRSAADRLEAGVARLRTEQQQVIVNGEIAHRLKNMLTMVQAIASQTLRNVTDREAVYAFERRLMALSAAHDALLQTSWTQADLQTIAATVIDAIGFSDRVDMSGPAVALGPRAALSFSLIVHELLTNACKYGALSNDDGEVSLTWSILSGQESDLLSIQWRERGGPPVVPPTRRGFGSKLISIGLVGTGGVDVRYEPSGFAADLHASLRHLVQG